MKTMKRTFLLMSVILLISCMLVPAFGQSGTHVFDEAGVLASEDFEKLEIRAGQVSAQYEVGVYIAAVANYTDYGRFTDIWDCGRQLFEANDFGLGTEHNGIFLLLSMSDRDYAIIQHGSKADEVFTETVIDKLEDRIIYSFGRNDYADGFSRFIESCADFMKSAEQGTPVGYSEPASGYYEEEDGIGIFAVIPGAIAAVITGVVMCASMKSSGVKHNADSYAVSRSFTLSRRSDMFLNRTVSRVRRQQPSNSGHGGSSGSHHHSGGGYSGRSGKF